MRTPLRGIAVAGARAGAASVSRLALSVLFNSWFYLGMAEALGGHAAFRRTIVRPSGGPGS